MEKKEKNILARFSSALFQKRDLSWPKLLLFAVASAVLTALFLIVPVFKNTSFE